MKVHNCEIHLIKKKKIIVSNFMQNKFSRENIFIIYSKYLREKTQLIKGNF